MLRRLTSRSGGGRDALHPQLPADCPGTRTFPLQPRFKGPNDSHMKSPCLILAVLCAGGLSALANEAAMSIASISIRTSSATATDLLGATYRLEFTSDLSEELIPNSFNGEWYATVGTVGYESFYQFENLETGEVGTGFLTIEIPNSGDANLNFLTDFFEVDQAVQGSTSGALESGPDPVPVSALWNRVGGSAGGVVQLTVPVEFGEILFDIPFEVFEYRGTLTYTPPADVGTPIEARVNLPRVGVPDQRFAGPFPLRLAADGTLIRQATRWSGPGDMDFDVLGSFDIDEVEFLITKVPRRPQYAGAFFFLDGDPSTPFQDEYDIFDVFISDPNDADNDGLPDLTDPADVPPPTVTPEARLELVDGNLVLQVKAKAGARVTIESRPALTGGNWTAVQSLTLANDSESLALPALSAAAGYWRVTSP